MAARWRRRIESWNWPVEVAGRLVASSFRLGLATSRWTVEGDAEFRAALAEGPVIVVLWHEHIALGPHFLTRPGAPFVSVRDPSPAGRVGGVVQARFGMHPIGVRSGGGPAATRAVLAAARAGRSLALAADGPLGPARVLGPAPLDWARVTGLPVFAFAWASSRMTRAGSWDRMRLPRLFGRGHAVLRRWPEAVPRKPEPHERERLEKSLSALLTEVTDAADRAVGMGNGFR